MEPIFISVLFLAAFLLPPFWKIFTRAGLNPYLSLTVLIPFFGFIIAGLILAVSDWNIKPQTKRL
ncbi:MAG: hypothetical protein PF589_02565 [Gammaproteobacteria bacterium]|jgi:TRAP-type C4-dicarboxylate transport system permease small subunit|nr:hypothetical protein [Gammaproteobacteria bacterium]